VRDDVIEIVAIGLFAEDEELSVVGASVCWDAQNSAYKNHYTVQARAAIRALESAGYRIVGRELTDGMKAVLCDLEGPWPINSLVEQEVWQAAFDAAPLYGEQP
jgi:hypothetical protein